MTEDDYPLLLHFPYFDLYRKQVVKQPDLVFALLVRGDAFTPEEKARNFAYYEALTVRDSSLSACIQSIVAAEVGHLDLAYDYLGEAALLDLDDLEHNTRDGLHIASLAGTWLALVMGFGGMRNFGEPAHGAGLLTFAPRLPAALTRLAFRLAYLGRRISVEITPAEATYLLRTGRAGRRRASRHPGARCGRASRRPGPSRRSVRGPAPSQPRGGRRPTGPVPSRRRPPPPAGVMRSAGVPRPAEPIANLAGDEPPHRQRPGHPHPPGRGRHRTDGAADPRLPRVVVLMAPSAARHRRRRLPGGGHRRPRLRALLGSARDRGLRDAAPRQRQPRRRRSPRRVRGRRRGPRLGFADRGQLGAAAPGRVPGRRPPERARTARRGLAGRPRRSPRWAASEEFYINYFQEPGRAEAEAEPDVRAWLLGFYIGASGNALRPPDGGTMATVPRGGRLRDRFVVPAELPAWLTEADVDFYTAEFEGKGFRGALNRYRNVDRDWAGPAAVGPAADHRAVALHRRRARRADHLGATGHRPLPRDDARARGAATYFPGAGTGSSRSGPKKSTTCWSAGSRVSRGIGGWRRPTPRRRPCGAGVGYRDAHAAPALPDGAAHPAGAVAAEPPR